MNSGMVTFLGIVAVSLHACRHLSVFYCVLGVAVAVNKRDQRKDKTTSRRERKRENERVRQSGDGAGKTAYW